MARFHVHVAVRDLQDSIRFYSALFGQAPLTEREDYAKWQLENPALNFAISTRGHAPGVNHLGFQAETPEEFERFKALSADVEESSKTAAAEAQCCYARSEKYWISDPQGLAWEHFLTLESIPVFGSDQTVDQGAKGACCIPLKTANESQPAAACCVPAARPAETGACC